MRKILFCLFLLLMILGCSKSGKKEKEIAPPPQQPVFFMAGKIEARDHVDVSSVITARILQVHIKVGDHVESGDTLVTLDRKDVQAQFQSVQKSYENAKLNYERGRNLFEKGFIPEQQKELLEYQLKQAKASLDLAKVQYDNGTINAPISGMVSEINVYNGETTSPNKVLLSIVNANHVYVEAYVPEHLIYKVAEGMKVDLRISEISDHDYHGIVTLIDPVVDPKSKTSLVRIEASDFDYNVKPGMMVLIGTEPSEVAKP
ncbi:MAG TPA: efflux RND transporter periplasmic adaptor subunit [Candidatus Cloacimonadota bacterium]|nr:efflux RND transporter periplasmic adaptor subunit [Candidatus Cloacimonadota bacterium]HPT72258.1 efflux RND transporter periplasmic adaptor subunit [Candidatus Cloacimonadota bacterium]